MSLLHRIHSENTSSSLEANLRNHVEDIKNFINEGGVFEENYYINHIGRELNKKIIILGLEKYFENQGGNSGIKLDNPDGGGYRPVSINFVLAS